MHRLIEESLPFALTGATALTLLAAGLLASLPPAGGISRSEAAQASRIPDAEIAAGTSLTLIRNPDQALVSKMVQTTLGETVGRVVDVSTQADGTLRSVRVSLPGQRGRGRRTVRIDVENLLYLPRRDVIVTRFTKAEIADLIGGGKSPN